VLVSLYHETRGESRYAPQVKGGRGEPFVLASGAAGGLGEALPVLEPEAALAALGRFNDETLPGGGRVEEVLHIVQNHFLRNLEEESQLLHGPGSLG